MKNNFQVKAIRGGEFDRLFTLNQSALEEMGAIRMTADKKPGFPCRVSLEDVEAGEEVILLPYQHHKTNSPYQASGPIFVRKNARATSLAVNELPLLLNHRLLSLRGYDKEGIMLVADVTKGDVLREKLDKMLQDPDINYLHIHNAKQGCFLCVVERGEGNNNSNH